MSATLAVEELIESVRAASPDAVKLATVVSIASRVEPFLLRRARIYLCPGVEAGIEVELWHSPLVEASSRQAMTLRPDVANALQKELRGSGRLQDAYDLIAECHKGLPEAITMEEEITWLLLKDDNNLKDDDKKKIEEKITGLLRKAANTLVEGSQPDLAQWVARFLSRADESIRKFPAAWILNLAASSRLGGVQVMPASDPPPDVKSSELFWAVAGANKTGTLYVGREGNELVLSVTPPQGAGGAATPIPIPVTDPVVVAIGDRQTQAPRLYRLDLSGREILRVPLTSQSMQLRTAAGDVYDIAIPTTTQTATQAETTQGADQVALPEAPYPGPRPFSTDEATIFFGRNEAVRELVERLVRQHIVVLTGPAGSGKSSLLRAGLVAQLQHDYRTGVEGDWEIILTRVGSNPFYNLARSLALALYPDARSRGDGFFRSLEETLRKGNTGLLEVVSSAPQPRSPNLLLCVDQFEELFRRVPRDLSDPRAEAEAFADLLFTTPRGGPLFYVIATLRSDFLSDAATLRGLREVFPIAEYRIPPLGRTELEDAIVRPLLLYGWAIDVKVSERMAEDASAEETYLPQMQYALRRLWEFIKGRTDPLIRMADYEAIGGFRSALMLGAESIFTGFDERRRHTTEVMFRRLTERDQNHQYFRRPATVGDIAAAAGVSAEEVASVAIAFNSPDQGLLTPTADVPLEATTVLDISLNDLYKWDRLQDWAKAEAEFADLYRELEKSGRDWTEAKGGLWTGRKLQQALDWRSHESPNAAWAARYGQDFDNAMRFLDESQRQRDRQANEPPRQQTRTFRYLYYVSYARADRDKYLNRFLEELRSEVRALSGVDVDKVSFEDQRQIEPGQRWETALVEGLQSSKVLVSIVSPTYTRNEYAGKEVQSFRNAGRALQRQAPGQPVANIFPIIWIPPPRLPVVFESIQLSQADLSESYARQGARYVATERSREMKKLVRILAGRIVDLASKIPDSVPAAEMPPISEIQSAWEQALPRQQQSSTPGTIRFFIAAGSTAEMTAVRKNVQAYGNDGLDWKPFSPDNPLTVENFTRPVAADAGFRHQHDVVRDDLIDQIRRSEQVHEIAILLVDVWALQSWSYRRILQSIDQQRFGNLAIIVAGDNRDEEVIKERDKLFAAVNDTFKNQKGTRTATFVEVWSRDEFVRKLQEMIIVIKDQILKAGTPETRIPDDPSRPLL